MNIKPNTTLSKIIDKYGNSSERDSNKNINNTSNLNLDCLSNGGRAYELLIKNLEIERKERS